MRSYLLGLLTLVAPLSGCEDEASGASPASGPPTVASARLAVPMDKATFQHPEGIIADGDDLLVGLLALGQVLRVTPDGTTTTIATLDPPIPFGADGPGAVLLGLALGTDGTLYAGVGALGPDATPGIYRARPGEDTLTRFAADDALIIPNALAFGPDGRLYASESLSGTIYRVGTDGSLEIWLQHEHLTGTTEPCPGTQVPLPAGINGFAFAGDHLVAANTTRATLVTIPIQPDGSAGPPSILAGPDCALLGGADGVAARRDGSLLVTAQNNHRLLWVAADGSEVTPLVTGAPLDEPANLALTSPTDVYIANVGFFSAPEKAQVGIAHVRLTD